MALLEIVFLLLGIYLIVKGSEWITDAIASFASFLNTTNVALGLVLVSIILSLPELVVSLTAVSISQTGLALGVSLGSVVVNIGLIIGLTAIIKKIRIPRHVITRDAIFMLVATLVVVLVALEDLVLTRRDGIIFLLLFIPYLINVYEQEKLLSIIEKRKESAMIARTLQMVGKIGDRVVIKEVKLMFVFGLIALLGGSALFTHSLVYFAVLFNIPMLIVGLTIGALGPSIPNLAAAIQAIRKGYDELAISETIGSNIFTLLVTIGVIAIIQPITVDSITASITTPALLIITGVFFVFILRGRIGRLEGVILVLLYIAAITAEFLARVRV